MMVKKPTQTPAQAAVAHLNELLDEALQETFPASDPIAITIELESSEIQSKSVGDNTQVSSGWRTRG